MITMRLIKQVVADYFNITVEDIDSNDRRSELAMPRHIAIYFSKVLTKNNNSQIKIAFNKSSHQTIVHAIAKIKALRPDNDEQMITIEKLIRDRYNG